MHFVSRWRDKSPFSKRVVTVPDATVLDWFRRGWDCADHGDPADWISADLGGDVYGLDSIFNEAQEQDLPRPETVAELRALLLEHLWVEGDDDGTAIRLGEHSLRVRTDDDEVDLAYYFIDDTAAATAPNRLAFLLHDTWPLPATTTTASTFTHSAPVRPLTPAGPGPESVFAFRLCWQRSGSNRNLDLEGAVVFPGLTLPSLAAHLRSVNDPTAHGWTDEARLLRALVAPGEDDMAPALHRYARTTGYDPTAVAYGQLAAHDHPDHNTAHGAVLKLLATEETAESGSASPRTSRRSPGTSTASSATTSGSSSTPTGPQPTQTWPVHCCATPPTGTRSTAHRPSPDRQPPAWSTSTPCWSCSRTTITCRSNSCGADEPSPESRQRGPGREHPRSGAHSCHKSRAAADSKIVTLRSRSPATSPHARAEMSAATKPCCF
jgi:hypothetical protein